MWVGEAADPGEEGVIGVCSWERLFCGAGRRGKTTRLLLPTVSLVSLALPLPFRGPEHLHFLLTSTWDLAPVGQA